MDFLIICAAAWRLAFMFAQEDGPWSVFRRVRKRLRAGEFGGATLDATRLTPEELECAMQCADVPRSMLGNLLSCIYCLSVWVAAVIVASYALWPATGILWSVFAVSAAVVFIDAALDRLRG